MNVCFFSPSNHRPSEARIKRYTHNDPIMSALRLTRDKCASKKLIATSQRWKGGLTVQKKKIKKNFSWVWLRKYVKGGNLISRKTRGHCQECCSLHSSVRGRWSKCGQILVRDVTFCFLLPTDATPAGYSKQTVGPRKSMANTLGQVWFLKLCKHGGAGENNKSDFQGEKKKDFFYCVTRINICKLLTRTRHREQKRYTSCVWL